MGVAPFVEFSVAAPLMGIAPINKHPAATMDSARLVILCIIDRPSCLVYPVALTVTFSIRTTASQHKPFPF